MAAATRPRMSCGEALGPLEGLLRPLVSPPVCGSRLTLTLSQEGGNGTTCCPPACLEIHPPKDSDFCFPLNLKMKVSSHSGFPQCPVTR